MTFTGMLGRVAEEIRWRVRNGEISERGLARLAGLSQPHVHNVLKGVRVLSPESADRLLRALGLNAADLLLGTPEPPACALCTHRRALSDVHAYAGLALSLTADSIRDQPRPRE